MRRLIGALLMMGCGLAAAAAQDINRPTYRESFDGPRPDLYLNGLLSYGTRAPWTISSDAGRLRLQNDSEDKAFRFIRIAKTRFGSDRLESTGSADIAASVRAEAASGGSVGLVFDLTPDSKRYRYFGLGGGYYYYYEKTGDELQPVEKGVSDAIKADGFNRLSVIRSGRDVLMQINGVTVARVGGSVSMPLPLGQLSLGLAAIGKGDFLFDDVTITRDALAPLDGQTLGRARPLAQLPDGTPLFRSSELREAEPVCDLPRAGKDVPVIVVSGGRATFASTVDVSGGHGVTLAKTVSIEPGAPKLYVVLGLSGPAIWRLEGAIERIDQVVVLAERQNSGRLEGALGGVVGVPADRVHFLNLTGCPTLAYGADEYRRRLVEGRLSKATGSGDVRLAQLPEAGAQISLPSLAVQPLPRPTPPSDMAQLDNWKAEVSLAPGGLIDFDPASVVTNGKAEKGKLLPGAFGISQLIGQGKMKRLKGGAFEIDGTIERLPVMAGGRQRYMLTDGVAMPGGLDEDDCVISATSGELLFGRSNCLR